MNAILLLALVAEPASIDRGELKTGALLTQVFQFTNRSPNAIEITGLKVSCGCTKSAFDKQKLAPGETARLTVDVNTLAQAAGPWSWKASIRFKVDRGEIEEEIPVEMKGTLVREISLTPPGLGLSLESGSITKEVVVSDSRGTPLIVKSLASNSTFLSATMHTEKPGRTLLKITLAENAPLGEYQELIVLATNDSTYPELRVPVTVSKKSPAKVKAYPEEVSLDSLPLTERILIRRPDGKPIQIATCELDNGNLKAIWSNGLDAVATVVVKAPDRVQGETGRAELRIKLAEPAGEIIIVPVRWGK